MTHFQQTIKHKQSFSSVIISIHEVSVRSALNKRLSPRCNFINEIFCLLSLCYLQLKQQIGLKLSTVTSIP
jgi:hypothetical protein